MKIFVLYDVIDSCVNTPSAQSVSAEWLECRIRISCASFYGARLSFPSMPPKYSQQQKRGFRNAPLGFLSLVFVNAVHDERDGVDGEEISGDAAMQCIHVTFFLLLQFPYDMLDGSYRVIPNHSRPRPAHHFAHSFFHLRAIAVDGTLLASWFVIAKLTAFQPCSSVL